MSQAASPDTTVQPRPATDEGQRKRTVELFLGMLDQGEKFSTTEWNEAREAYAGKPDKADWKRSNRFRRQTDTQQAYLHQQLAQPRVVPLEGMANEERAQKEAECDQALLRYLSKEIGLKITVARALKSAQLTNLGIVFHCVDRIRGVPTVRKFRPENIRWDKDCSGDLRQATWIAVIEYVSPEMLHITTGYDLEKLKRAAQKTSAAEQSGEGGEPGVMNVTTDARQRITSCLARCKFVRFYARNEIALYDDEPKATVSSPEDEPHIERYLTSHGLTEPRRYLELVDGIDEPLADEDEWPPELALDTDEWPITVLQLNDGEADGTVAAFTDYRHVQKINDAYDQILRDIDNRTAIALVLKVLLADGATIEASALKKLLQSGDVEVLKGLLALDGKPLMQILEGPPFPAVLPEVLAIFQQVGDETSAINEIQMGGDAQPQETATATQIRKEAAAIATSLRQTALEDFEAEIYLKMLAMARALCPRLSVVEVVSPQGEPSLVYDLAWVRPGTPEGLQALLDMGANPNVTATELLAAEDAELVEFGVEAMVGPALAQYWQENVPLAVSRRNCRVEVEHGTTRLSERMDRFTLMREVLMTLLLPLYQATGNIGLWIEAVKRILGKAGMSEFDNLVPPPPAPVVGVDGQPAGAVPGMAPQPQPAAEGAPA